MAKLLVVDDASFIRRWANRALTEKGHEVILAENGQQAIAAYQESRPDAVILDVTMPVMDGLTTLRELKKIDPNARVAMFTTRSELPIILEARKLGVRDFVAKPCEPDRLLAAVTRLLA